MLMNSKKIYIIATCIKDRGQKSYDFHFKGWFMGMRVERLVLEGHGYEVCKEYLINAIVLNYSDGVLKCRAISSKSIFNH
tara:strand:- start:509 stop:748 length:240 start_codon:yes stop_codon:yes gene_type:complete